MNSETLSAIYRYTLFFIFFFNDTATTEIYTLSLHDALPICLPGGGERECHPHGHDHRQQHGPGERSEEHTSELQSPCNLVCRLLLEKKKSNQIKLKYIILSACVGYAQYIVSAV